MEGHIGLRRSAIASKFAERPVQASRASQDKPNTESPRNLSAEGNRRMINWLSFEWNDFSPLANRRDRTMKTTKNKNIIPPYLNLDLIYSSTIVGR